MKKFFAVLSVVVALFVANNSAQAQVTTPVFYQGENIVSLTLGYGGMGFGQRLVYERSIMTLLDGQASIGVGGSLGNSFLYDSASDDGVKATALDDWFALGVVGSFHYQFIDNLDTYVQVGLSGGLWTGKATVSYEDIKVKTKDSDGFFGWTASLGARYYFRENWAVNAEIGYVIGSFFMAGVTYKF